MAYILMERYSAMGYQERLDSPVDPDGGPDFVASGAANGFLMFVAPVSVSLAISAIFGTNERYLTYLSDKVIPVGGCCVRGGRGKKEASHRLEEGARVDR